MHFALQAGNSGAASWAGLQPAAASVSKAEQAPDDWAGLEQQQQGSAAPSSQPEQLASQDQQLAASKAEGAAPADAATDDGLSEGDVQPVKQQDAEKRGSPQAAGREQQRWERAGSPDSGQV